MFRFLVGKARLYGLFGSNLKLDLGSQVTLGIGVYAGIYISQNYEVPRVDEPGKIVEKITAFMDEHKKDK